MTAPAKKSAVSVVEFQPQHRDGLFQLFRAQSPLHPELWDEKIFQWQQGKRFVALAGEKVVGHIAQLPQSFIHNGTPFTMGWAATLVLDTANPLIQTFAGVALLEQLKKNTEWTFGAVGVVPAIERTHQRLGFVVHRDLVLMYSRFLKPSKGLKAVEKSSLLAPAVHVANFVWSGKRTSQEIQFEEIQRFDPGWNSLWQKLLADQYRLYGARTSEYLNFKLAQPGKTNTILIARTKSGEVSGYVVFRRGQQPSTGLDFLRISDLVGTNDAKIALLYRALRTAKEWDVDAIVALGSSTDKTLFRTSGLWLSKPFLVVFPPGLTGALHFSSFESDLDNLW